MVRPGRKCDCCGCEAPQDGVDRRDFLKTVAAGTAALALGQTGVAGETETKPFWIENQLPPRKLAEWKEQVFDLTPPRVYNPKDNPDARFPLGGIGTGNIYLGVDGRMTGWSVTNSQGEFDVGEPFFAIRAANGAGKPVVRVLATKAPADTPAIANIKMVGEYPVAELRYRDAALPVSVSLTAYTPFVPLDSKRSGYPAAVFQFRVKNRSQKKLRVALMAALPNCVGLANEAASGLRHPNYGGNFNEFAPVGNLRMIRLRATPGKSAMCEGPVSLFIHSEDRDFDRVWRSTTRHEKPDSFTITRAKPSGDILKQLASTPEGARVVWLENPGDVGVAFLKALNLAAKNGATIVFSGDDPRLLRRAIGASAEIEKKGLPDIVFEDFESGNYSKWTIEGEAFGKAPAAGTLPNQQPVGGFLGKRLVNSFLGGDGPQGKMTSQSFTIERPLIRFLIGGGKDPKRTCMNLVVGGKIVRSASGSDLEQLDWKVWDVSDLMGKRAHLEIIDAAGGPWGHINVDQIVFTENAADEGLVAALRDLLPIGFSDITAHRDPIEARLGTALPSVGMNDVRFDGWTEYREMKLLEDSEVVLKTPAGSPLIVRRRIGEGCVYLVAARLLSNQWSGGRRTRALSLLAGLAGVRMSPSAGLAADAHNVGELALATPIAEGGAVLAWDSPRRLIEDFASAKGVFEPKQGAQSQPTEPGVSQGAALVAEVELGPCVETTIPFLLTWHFPNDIFSRNGQRIGHQYSKFWPDATAVATDLNRNLHQLEELTQRFRKTFYDSTLPYWLLDCVTSQMSTIRIQGVCFWMENGIFAGWEGDWYCCQPTCTHVWGYEQTLARVFPDLERKMRYVDYKHQQIPEGGINNRVEIPIPQQPSGERPFVDGHCSCVLKAYREVLMCADDNWFKEYWPNIKKAVEYLILRDGNPPDGIIEDEQWHTYDVAAYGPNSFLGSYYLAALRAGEEMAKRAGEKDTAMRWREIFERGSRRLVELCWNGEYFQQNYSDYMTKPRQWGPGCLADQLIGQWWAHQLGLGYLVPQEYVRVALAAIFKYDWLSDMTKWQHRQRWFADGNDKGLLCCAWPKGGRPPQQILYSDEVWTGVEYQVAAHMIAEGMLEEAFCIVKGARERYDGQPKTKYDRNPWDEKECGGHYARAMSSWSLLTALSGFLYDGPRGQMTFAPAITPEDFKSFFTAAEGWGNLHQIRKSRRQQNSIKVAYGKLTLGELTLAVPENAKKVKAMTMVAGSTLHIVKAKLEVQRGMARLVFDKPVTIMEGQTLAVQLDWV
jgi:uncharacterized protein (DUF608 family)